MLRVFILVPIDDLEQSSGVVIHGLQVQWIVRPNGDWDLIAAANSHKPTRVGEAFSIHKYGISML
jgi:hypothetical protein